MVSQVLLDRPVLRVLKEIREIQVHQALQARQDQPERLAYQATAPVILVLQVSLARQAFRVQQEQPE
jgi:hypothetical protein